MIDICKDVEDPYSVDLGEAMDFYELMGDRRTYDFSLRGRLAPYIQDFLSKDIGYRYDHCLDQRIYTVERFCSALKDNPTVKSGTIQTVRNILNDLVKKGMLGKHKHGSMWVYIPTDEYIRSIRPMVIRDMTFADAMTELGLSLEDKGKGVMMSQLTNRLFAYSDKQTPGSVQLICLNWETQSGQRLFGTGLTQEEILSPWLCIDNGLTMRGEKPDRAVMTIDDNGVIEAMDVIDGEITGGKAQIHTGLV